MRKMMILAALAASSVAVPTVAQAQRAPVLVVDTETVMSTCTACRSATTQLQQQAQAAQQLQTSLMTPLQTEAQQLETATKALGNKEPDAALKKRAETFRQRLQSAQQQIAQRAQSLRSTEQHVQQQIGERLIQVVEQVRARRSAAVVLSKNSTIANDNSVDVTTEVLNALNQALPSVSVTPMQQPAQPQQQQPTGR